MTERSEIQFGRTPIPFRIRRSDQRRKTVALTIERGGTLLVTAPKGVPVDRLNGIVHHKARWVVQRIKRISDLAPPPTPREFASGETVLYLGRQYRLKVLTTDGDASDRIWAGWYHVAIPSGLSERRRHLAVRCRLRASLMERAGLHLNDRLAVVCRERRIERPSMIVREQRKRWGSCDTKGVLRINWRIVQAPVALIDYVLVHELIHVELPRHGRAFWAALGRVMPDYEDRRARLRELGPSLVW